MQYIFWTWVIAGVDMSCVCICEMCMITVGDWRFQSFSYISHAVLSWECRWWLFSDVLLSCSIAAYPIHVLTWHKTPGVILQDWHGNEKATWMHTYWTYGKSSWTIQEWSSGSWQYNYRLFCFWMRICSPAFWLKIDCPFRIHKIPSKTATFGHTLRSLCFLAWIMQCVCVFFGWLWIGKPYNTLGCGMSPCANVGSSPGCLTSQEEEPTSSGGPKLNKIPGKFQLDNDFSRGFFVSMLRAKLNFVPFFGNIVKCWILWLCYMCRWRSR